MRAASRTVNPRCFVGCKKYLANPNRVSTVQLGLSHLSRRKVPLEKSPYKIDIVSDASQVPFF